MRGAFCLPTGAALLTTALLACPVPGFANQPQYKAAAEQAAEDIETIRKSDPRIARHLEKLVEQQEAIIADMKARREEVYRESNRRLEEIASETDGTLDSMSKGVVDATHDYFKGGGPLGGLGAVNAADDVVGMELDLATLYDLQGEQLEHKTSAWVVEHTKELLANEAEAKRRLRFFESVIREAAKAQQGKTETGVVFQQAVGEFSAAWTVVAQRFAAKREEEKKRRRAEEIGARTQGGRGSETTGSGETSGGAGSGGSAGGETLFDRNHQAIQRWQKNFSH